MPALREIKDALAAVWCDPSNRNERATRLMKAVGWQLWKRGVRRPRTVELFNGFHFRAYPNCTISSSAFYSRVPNGRHIEFLRSRLTGNGTLIDVGANVGLISILLADKIAHALLFEPNPAAAARARENISLNPLKFEVHELALSDQVGTVVFENIGGANPCNRTVEGFSSTAPTITVPRTTLDKLLAAHEPLPAPISAVKIDVEGHENSVLRGMAGTLRDQRPRIVMFEYLQRTNLKKTFEIFSRCGYRVSFLTKAGTPRWADLNIDPLQDLFAFPEELCHELAIAS